tara:strand:+ start:55 stop:540 length:486 start_codon:yes stop_codon:yes gene_type:complete
MTHGKNPLLIAVFCLAGIQLCGFLLGSKSLTGLGRITAASPLPLVFTSHDGLETFAQSYAVEVYHASKRKPLRVEVTPALYSQLSGSYNRRNVYGAIFSYGPILSQGPGADLVDAVAKYGFCAGGPLLATFDIPSEPQKVVLESKSYDDSKALWRYEVKCR